MESEHLRQLDYAVQGFDGARDVVLLSSIHRSGLKVEAAQVETEMTEMTEKFVIKTWRSLRYC